jgi:amino acid transporter
MVGMREQLKLGAYVILVFGIVLLLASLFADPLALGTPHTGFGWKQILGTLLGLAIAFGGWRLVRHSER